MTNIERKSLLTLIELLPPIKYKPRMGRFQCECGNVTEARAGEVRTLRILSCGCWSSKHQRELHLTHGLSKHPLYGIWKAMIQRCHKVDHKQFPDYGARGIIVCEEWRNDFMAFYNWALTNGWQKGLHLDKDILPERLVTKEIGYSPRNCCFVTRKVNNRNKRDTTKVQYEGTVMALSEVAEKYGLTGNFVRERMNRFGWDLQKALTTPKGLSKFKHKTKTT